MLAGSLYRMIKGTSVEGARQEEVAAPFSLDWPATAITPERRAEELKPLLTQAKRGTIALSRRIDAHPDSADLYRRRGILYTELSTVWLALPDLTKARELGSTHPELEYAFAQAHLAAGALTLSQASADAYLRLAPADARAYLLKATAELRRTKGAAADHCRQALLDLNRALELDSTLFAARMMRGYALATTEQPAPAPADYRRALAVAPQNTQVHFFLAEALLGAGGTTEACQHFQQALPFAPKTVKAYLKKYCR